MDHDTLVSSALDFLNPISSKTSNAENVKPGSAPEPEPDLPKTPVSGSFPKRVIFCSPINQPDVETPRLPVIGPLTTKLRSILRPARQSVVVEEKTPSFTDLIRTSLEAFSSDDVSVRLDAYGVVHRRLAVLADALSQAAADDSSAEKNNPEDEPLGVISAALKRSVPQFSTFFLRDLAPLVDPENETRMPMAAMKCLLCLLRNIETAPLFTPRFYISLVDLLISILNRPGGVQKFLAKSVILVVDCVAYRARVIPRDKLRPLLDSLQSLRSIRSNGIAGVRLAIYTALVLENPDVMCSLAGMWIKDVFTGFVSPVADLRARAIRLAEFAGSVPVNNDDLASAVADLFKTTVKPTRGAPPFFTYFLSDLWRGLKSTSPDARRDILRIWAAVILMLRNFHGGVEKYTYFKPLLAVFQACLNSTDPDVRIRSFVSLNSLVYAVMPDQHTDRAIRRLLILPVIEKVASPPGPENGAGRRVWQAAMLAWVNLLYYAFRPGMPDEMVTLFWDEYVAGPVLNIDRWRDLEQANFVFRVFSCLLWRDESVAEAAGFGEVGWQEERAVIDTSIECMSCLPEELPPLPPSWVRSNIEHVLSLFDCIASLRWAANGDTTTSPLDVEEAEGRTRLSTVSIGFNHIVMSLEAAASREVRPSAESQAAFSELLSFVLTVWDRSAGPKLGGTVLDMIHMTKRVAEVFKVSFLFPSPTLPHPCDTVAPIQALVHRIATIEVRDGGSDASDCPALEALDSVIPDILSAIVPLLTSDQFFQCLADLVQCVYDTPAMHQSRKDAIGRNLIERTVEDWCRKVSWRTARGSDLKATFEGRLGLIMKLVCLDVGRDLLTKFYKSCYLAAREAGSSAGSGGADINAILAVVETVSAAVVSSGPERVKHTNGNGFDPVVKQQSRIQCAIIASVVVELEAELNLDLRLSSVFSAKQAGQRSLTAKMVGTPPRTVGAMATGSDPFVPKRPVWAGSERLDPYDRLYALVNDGTTALFDSQSESVLSCLCPVLKSVAALIESSPAGYAIAWGLLPALEVVFTPLPCDLDTFLKDPPLRGEANHARLRIWTALCSRVETLDNPSSKVDMARVLLPVWKNGINLKRDSFAWRFREMCQQAGFTLSRWDQMGWGPLIEVWSSTGFKSRLPFHPAFPVDQREDMGDEDDNDDDDDGLVCSPSISKDAFHHHNSRRRSISTLPSGSPGNVFKSPLQAKLQAHLHPPTVSPAHFTCVISSPIKARKHLDSSAFDDDGTNVNGTIDHSDLDGDPFTIRRGDVVERESSPTPAGQALQIQASLNGVGDGGVDLQLALDAIPDEGQPDRLVEVKGDVDVDMDIDIPSSPPELFTRPENDVLAGPDQVSISTDPSPVGDSGSRLDNVLPTPPIDPVSAPIVGSAEPDRGRSQLSARQARFARRAALQALVRSCRDAGAAQEKPTTEVEIPPQPAQPVPQPLPPSTPKAGVEAGGPDGVDKPRGLSRSLSGKRKRGESNVSDVANGSPVKTERAARRASMPAAGVVRPEEVSATRKRARRSLGDVSALDPVTGSGAENEAEGEPSDTELPSLTARPVGLDPNIGGPRPKPNGLRDRLAARSGFGLGAIPTLIPSSPIPGAMIPSSPMPVGMIPSSPMPSSPLPSSPAPKSPASERIRRRSSRLNRRSLSSGLSSDGVADVGGPITPVTPVNGMVASRSLISPTPRRRGGGGGGGPAPDDRMDDIDPDETTERAGAGPVASAAQDGLSAPKCAIGPGESMIPGLTVAVPEVSPAMRQMISDISSQSKAPSRGDRRRPRRSRRQSGAVATEQEKEEEHGDAGFEARQSDDVFGERASKESASGGDVSSVSSLSTVSSPPSPCEPMTEQVPTITTTAQPVTPTPVTPARRRSRRRSSAMVTEHVSNSGEAQREKSPDTADDDEEDQPGVGLTIVPDLRPERSSVGVASPTTPRDLIDRLKQLLVQCDAIGMDEPDQWEVGDLVGNWLRRRSGGESATKVKANGTANGTAKAETNGSTTTVLEPVRAETDGGVAVEAMDASPTKAEKRSARRRSVRKQ